MKQNILHRKNLNQMSKKQCSECGEGFFGRIDKRFCSDNCRSHYNNRMNRDQNTLMRNINNLLRKNRRILLSFKQQNLLTIHRKTLLDQGFNFNYFTNELKDQVGRTYRFCYDHGYLNLESDYLRIVEEGHTSLI